MVVEPATALARRRETLVDTKCVPVQPAAHICAHNNHTERYLVGATAAGAWGTLVVIRDAHLRWAKPLRQVVLVASYAHVRCTGVFTSSAPRTMVREAGGVALLFLFLTSHIGMTVCSVKCSFE